MSDLSGFFSGLTQETLRIIDVALWNEEDEVTCYVDEALTDDQRRFLVRSRGIRRLCSALADEKGQAYYQNPYFKVWEREYARRFRVVRMDKVQ